MLTELIKSAPEILGKKNNGSIKKLKMGPLKKMKQLPRVAGNMRKTAQNQAVKGFLVDACEVFFGEHFRLLETPFLHTHTYTHSPPPHMSIYLA